jgi:hypothetical protein
VIVDIGFTHCNTPEALISNKEIKYTKNGRAVVVLDL